MGRILAAQGNFGRIGRTMVLHAHTFPSGTPRARAMTPLTCVCSGGGPLILIAAELSPLWRGTSPPLEAPASALHAAEHSASCDYDRACDDVDDVFEVGDTFAGTLAVGPGRALILDGEASTAACVWGGGLLIVRSPPFESEEELLRAVGELDDASWTPTAHTLELPSGRVFVFDSAYEGATTSDRIDAQGGVLDIQAPPGRYEVVHASLPHPLGGALPLIRLVPAPPLPEGRPSSSGGETAHVPSSRDTP